MNNQIFNLNTKNIELTTSLVKWDSDIFGINIAQINKIKIQSDNKELIDNDFSHLLKWIKENSIDFISCRLSDTQLKESFLLEEYNFKFIEMVLHPTFSNLKNINIEDQTLHITEVYEKNDLEEIKLIAMNTFRYERFHIDPRIGANLGGVRYSNWVNNVFYNNSNQKLLKISEGNQIIGFFIIENLDSETIYWHLTGISDSLKSKGYGTRVWKSMLKYHQINNISKVKTTISARNIHVLNLYSKLNFRFDNSEMTFHYLINNFK